MCGLCPVWGKNLPYNRCFFKYIEFSSGIAVKPVEVKRI